MKTSQILSGSMQKLLKNYKQHFLRDTSPKMNIFCTATLVLSCFLPQELIFRILNFVSLNWFQFERGQFRHKGDSEKNSDFIFFDHKIRPRILFKGLIGIFKKQSITFFKGRCSWNFTKCILFLSWSLAQVAKNQIFPINFPSLGLWDNLFVLIKIYILVYQKSISVHFVSYNKYHHTFKLYYN